MSSRPLLDPHSEMSPEPACRFPRSGRRCPAPMSRPAGTPPGSCPRLGAILGTSRTILNDRHCLGCLTLDRPDQGSDLQGGVLGILGQLADLLGNNGETAALIAGAGGLDRCGEREQVGLLRDCSCARLVSRATAASPTGPSSAPRESRPAARCGFRGLGRGRLPLRGVIASKPPVSQPAPIVAPNSRGSLSPWRKPRAPMKHAQVIRAEGVPFESGAHAALPALS